VPVGRLLLEGQNAQVAASILRNVLFFGYRAIASFQHESCCCGVNARWTWRVVGGNSQSFAHASISVLESWILERLAYHRLRYRNDRSRSCKGRKHMCVRSQTARPSVYQSLGSHTLYLALQQISSWRGRRHAHAVIASSSHQR